jgi:cysteinyl-tRNA synthetase
MDFALWKSSKPGEPAWDSPWGPGRPGWHIECSAMSMRHLGETFDIHGGGMDLIFPHHENEIAQSCGATGKEFARYWIHNGFVQINQEKMSKSLGNFFTIREIFEKSEWSEKITGELLRFFLLSTHYKSPLDFSDQSLKEAKNALDGFYDLFKRLTEPDGRGTADKELAQMIERCRSTFQEAMDEDFSTPSAIVSFQNLRSGVNKLLDQGLSTQERTLAREEFRSLGNTLGLFQLDEWRFNPDKRSVEVVDVTSVGGGEAARVRQKDHPSYRSYVSEVPTLKDDDIQRKVNERDEARRNKDFKKSDEIRKELASFGIIIEDKPDGTSRWKR